MLLVDDEAALREIMAEALAGSGLTVVEAANGEEAVALALAGPSIDAIVTDEEMPRRGGREMLRRLRDAGVTAPAILISGSPLPPRAERAHLGIVSALQKPCALDELVVVVMLALKA